MSRLSGMINSAYAYVIFTLYTSINRSDDCMSIDYVNVPATE